MAKSTTTRLGLQRWTADTDSQDRTEFDGAHAQLEQLAAGFLQDEIGDRPAAAAAYAGFLFEATDEDGALYWCTGADWLGPFALVSDLDAAEVVFDPSGTDLESTDVEAAIKEVAAGSGSSVAVENHGNAGATLEIDLADGEYQSLTVSEALSLTTTGWPSSGTGQYVTLEVQMDDEYAVTWEAAIKWHGDEPPPLAEDTRTLVVLFSRDGGTTVEGSHGPARGTA